MAVLWPNFFCGNENSEKHKSKLNVVGTKYLRNMYDKTRKIESRINEFCNECGLKRKEIET